MIVRGWPRGIVHDADLSGVEIAEHQEAVAVLLLLLRGYLKSERVGHALASPSDVELEPEFLTPPDLFVMPAAEWRRVHLGRIVRELMLAVEVLSPSSAGHDRVKKRPGYQSTCPRSSVKFSTRREVGGPALSRV